MGLEKQGEDSQCGVQEDCTPYPCHWDIVQKEGTQVKKERGKEMTEKRETKEERKKATTGQDRQVNRQLNSEEVCPCRKLREHQEERQPQARGVTVSPLKEGCLSSNLKSC